MLFHIFITAVMIAAVAAFLILWYLWVKKRIEVSYALVEDRQILFPFRNFSWLLIGLLIAVCLAQIHFVRVSYRVHEHLAKVAAHMDDRPGTAAHITELKQGMARLESRIAAMQRPVASPPPAVIEKPQTQPAEKNPSRSNKENQRTDRRRAERRAPNADRTFALVQLKGNEPVDEKKDRRFAGEARASSAQSALSAEPERQNPPNPGIASEPRSEPEKEPEKVWSMSLDRMGKVTADSLRVRERPSLRAPVIGVLKGGQTVKVTEKRFLDDRIFYRVAMPDGKKGWVHFRYLEVLAGNSTPSEG